MLIMGEVISEKGGGMMLGCLCDIMQAERWEYGKLIKQLEYLEQKLNGGAERRPPLPGRSEARATITWSKAWVLPIFRRVLWVQILKPHGERSVPGNDKDQPTNPAA